MFFKRSLLVLLSGVFMLSGCADKASDSVVTRTPSNPPYFVPTVQPHTIYSTSTTPSNIPQLPVSISDEQLEADAMVAIKIADDTLQKLGYDETMPFQELYPHINNAIDQVIVQVNNNLSQVSNKSEAKEILGTAVNVAFKASQIVENISYFSHSKKVVLKMSFYILAEHLFGEYIKIQ